MMSKTTEAKLREEIKRLSTERDYWRSEAQKRLQEREEWAARTGAWRMAHEQLCDALAKGGAK